MFVKNRCFWAWFGMEESALKVFAIALYLVSKYLIVGMSIEFLLVCYMKIDKQAGAKLSQAHLANYELC